MHMRYLIILLFLFISCQLHAQNDFLEKDTVDEAHTDIDAKNELIKTKSTNISSGIFRINVVNNTDSQINIFVNKKFAFKLFVKKNGGYGVYKANDFAIVGK